MLLRLFGYKTKDIYQVFKGLQYPLTRCAFSWHNFIPVWVCPNQSQSHQVVNGNTPRSLKLDWIRANSNVLRQKVLTSVLSFCKAVHLLSWFFISSLFFPPLSLHPDMLVITFPGTHFHGCTHPSTSNTQLFNHLSEGCLCFKEHSTQAK